MDFSLLKDFLDSLTAWRIPGNNVSVYIDNNEVFSYCSGYEDYENKIPMTGKKLINIYSCSKIATVVAALRLFEEGKFKLDDPLYAFIPEYKVMIIRGSDGEIHKAKKEITLRHLFTMTAGLTYNLKSPAISKARELTDGKMNTLTVAKCIAEDPLSFEPGENWQYSLCHDILAAVVEVVSGKKFRDYVTETIFLPLCMNDSVYHSKNILNRVAKQYEFRDSDEEDIVSLQAGEISLNDGKIIGVSKECGHVLGEEYDSGGAGITTSVSDYSKFLSALANGGIGPTGERILMPKTIDLLRTNQLNENTMKNFDWPQLSGYGYGLGVRTMLDAEKSGFLGNRGEFGWGGAAGATALIDPELKLSMFYAHHMLNPQEAYYQPRLRNALYACLKK